VKTNLLNYEPPSDNEKEVGNVGNFSGLKEDILSVGLFHMLEFALYILEINIGD
jgi:hypothetical protein